MRPPAFDPALCAQCSAPLAGTYCHRCGQRRLGPEDRTLGHLLREALASWTNLEGRWIRSLVALVFDTGALSRAWIEGRRRSYLAPFSLFLLVNLVFFVAPPMTDFDLHLDDHLGQPFYGERARAQVGARIAAEDVAYDIFAERFGEASSNVAKSLVILHVPVLALALLVAFGGRRWTAAEHAVVALHLFAFLLLAAQLVNWVVLPVVGWLAGLLPEGLGGLPPVGIIALAILMVGWFRALRRAYDLGRAPAAGLLVVAVVGLGVAHLLYRWVQFALVMALVSAGAPA
ncbi:MAG: DUF3667 domain-containing protein [Longimicrobiales bacterium]